MVHDGCKAHCQFITAIANVRHEERAEQFTPKSLTNAARLGSALIRTMDLYAIALYLLDHPDDDAFRIACRAAIEDTSGGIVGFPDP